MRITFQQVKERRFAKNRTRERMWSERYVPLNVLGKLIAPYPAYVLLNLGVHPDAVTMVSLACILFSAASFVVGHPATGVALLLVFILCDSVDGDMARCAGPSSYGGVFDSFGADFFYGSIPVAIGYFLFSYGVTVGGFSPHFIFGTGILVSITFLLYRLIKVKMVSFAEYIEHREGKKQVVGNVVRETVNIGLLHRLISLYRHVLIRANFFGEPGMVFWITVLVFWGRYEWLAAYLMVLCLYNLGTLLLQFVTTYMYFINTEKTFRPKQT